MRVISGSARGLKLLSPEGLETRPTTDRVKESIFNIIQPYIPAEKVLDLFGGSGALGIEALSRGSSFCVFVDTDKNAVDIIKSNLEKARLDSKADVIKKDVFLYLEDCRNKFSLIFLDPPYNKGFLNKVFDMIDKKSMLEKDGIIVVESEYGGEFPDENAFSCIRSVKYGRTAVSLFRHHKNGE